MVSRKENKVKRIVLLFISIWIAFAAYGEDNHKKERHPDDRKINVGIRGGFNSSMFLVSDLKIKDVKDLKWILFKYIEVYYNKKRLHSTLGYVSPEDFEKIFIA